MAVGEEAYGGEAMLGRCTCSLQGFARNLVIKWVSINARSVARAREMRDAGLMRGWNGFTTVGLGAEMDDASFSGAVARDTASSQSHDRKACAEPAATPMQIE